MFGWDCPKCGTQNEEPVNNNFYGSPIKHCIKCGYEHLERRWSEIAIDGPRKQANSISVNLLLLAFFAGIAWIGFWFREESNQTRLIQKTDILIFTGIVACIAIVYQIFRILTGYEDKVTKKYTEESEMRMRDLEYVKKLIRYGYAVPQKYRDGIDEVDVEISDNCDSEHYVQEHDVLFYATRLNITARYLNQISVKMIGYSPKQVIANYIMHKAKILLTTSSFSIQEISEKLGFKSQITFCRFFKKQESIAPSEYRFYKKP